MFSTSNSSRLTLLGCSSAHGVDSAVDDTNLLQTLHHGEVEGPGRTSFTLYLWD